MEASFTEFPCLCFQNKGSQIETLNQMVQTLMFQLNQVF